MRALFLGSGPYFREKLPEIHYNNKIKPFPNTEVYNLICDTLDLIPAPVEMVPFQLTGEYIVVHFEFVTL